MWRFMMLAWAGTALVQSAVVERLAVAIGQQVITELQVDEELRVTAFLNKQPIARDTKTRRTAADRLIQQLLVKREMGVSHYELPSAADVDEYFEGIAKSLGGRAGLSENLATYDLTVETLRAHLLQQLMTLRFIENRFRPDVDIPAADIESEYRREIADWKTTHSGAIPTLADSTESIQSKLTEQRVDNALDAWLEESRKQVNIVYLDKTLY